MPLNALVVSAIEVHDGFIGRKVTSFTDGHQVWVCWCQFTTIFNPGGNVVAFHRLGDASFWIIVLVLVSLGHGVNHGFTLGVWLIQFRFWIVIDGGQIIVAVFGDDMDKIIVAVIVVIVVECRGVWVIVGEQVIGIGIRFVHTLFVLPTR